jgi:hypothetical protein
VVGGYLEGREEKAMKYHLWVLVFAAGCGWFTSSEAATATAAGIAKIAEIVKQQTGRNLEEYPMQCDVESNPEAQEILMLCTISLKGFDQ